MNNLRQMKKYQSSSGAEPPGRERDDLNKRFKNKQDFQKDEFMDLSNINDIADLNELTALDKNGAKNGITEDSPVEVDDVEVDLDDQDIEEMERIMRKNMQYPKERGANGQHLDGFSAETPASGQSDNQDNQPEFFADGGKPQQMQNELQQLLAQSSSEQLLMINDENNDLHLTESEEQELRRKWLQENGLFSAGDSQQASPPLPASAEKDGDQNQSIELGEEPVALDPSNALMTEAFEDQRRANSNSPPLVANLHSGAAASQVAGKQGSSKAAADPLAKGAQQHSSPPRQDLKGHEKPPLSRLIGADPSEMKAMDAKDKHHNPKSSKDGEKAIDQSNQDGDENDSFHRLYNKEIKVNQDEIPLLLLELTDIAYKFIKKDQFEKAYVLLQKTESVLEVVNLEHSKRDRYFAYITYLNMAMCFQKLGMLEECIIYLKETIQVIEKPSFFKDISIAQRMKQMHMQCQLKLQLCAILSQTQKHTEAMENAKASVRLAHQILRDMYDLCVFYSNKIKFKDDFASLSLLLMDEGDEDHSQSLAAQNKSKQCYGTDLGGALPDKSGKHTKSEINEKMYQKQYIRENSPVRDIPFNILEESISMIERTALKLLPIMKELGNRLAGTSKNKGRQAFHTHGVENSIETKNLSEQKSILHDHLRSKKTNNDRGLLEDESEDIKDVDLEIKDKLDADKKAAGDKKAEDQVDMRTILGFLNQNEWILNLNIGNIMQIQPVRMRDFLQFHRNEHQLSRESFLEKLQLLVVSYFCVSTELRFIIQSRSGFMKAETKKEKELEQEYWHVKALDIACAFLPSECPLFNHILLSYQKHHDPTMQPIDEDKEQEDVLSVLRPLKGIENSKYQPIIREVENVYIDIAEVPLSPLSKCFDQRLMPKKVKTATSNVQTEPIEAPQPPLMKSQSVSIQDDLKEQEPEAPKQAPAEQQNKVYQDSETLTDIFDANNAYLDLSSSKYQENLMEKIINDPKINDTQQFLSKLITRVQSQEPEKFKAGQFQHNAKHGLANNNTQSQNFNNISYFQQQYASDQTINKTLTAGSSIGIEDQGIYGHQGQQKAKQGLMINKTKNTQSGQLNYKQKRHGQNFDDLQYSFDMKSQFGKNHVRSMYGAGDGESDATAIGTAMKHHIASQGLAPSQTVFTEHKSSKKGAVMSKNSHLISHKKNQSISGLMKSEDMFKNTNLKGKQTMEYSSVNRHFNNSVNSNFSSKQQHGTKKKLTGTATNKSNDKKEQARMAQAGKMLGQRNDKASSNINLSNQKHQKSQKLQKNQQTSSTLKKSLDKSGRHGKALNPNKQNKSYQSTHVVHKIPMTKNEDSLMKEIGDVMSSSYSESENEHCSSPSSGADPDLQHAQIPSQPESSMSEMNKTHTDQSMQSIHNTNPDENISAIFRSQEERDRYLAAKNKYNTHQDPNRPKADAQGQQPGAPSNENIHSKKQRPSSSSAVTNYTSGQSALRSKLAKQRVNNLQQQMAQNLPRGQMSKQLAKIQQQQNLLSHMKQAKQRQLESGAPLVTKKKSKVLSRKKYGSDKSSNSPPQNATQSGGHHGYSIAQGPFSIFDSGNSHSISKFSNLQQSKQSIPDQPTAMYQYQDKSLSKKKKSTHMNSQTIQIENKNQQIQRASKPKKEANVQNQSENILSRLQNLLVKKEDDKLNRYDNMRKVDDMRKVEKKAKNLASGPNIGSQLQVRSQYASHGQYSNSNPRKSANSIGSLGYSHSNQTRQSRHSANSKQSHSRKSRENNSKKSRPSRSKSSGKSGKGQRSVSNERSKDRQLNNQMNISNQEGFNTSNVSLTNVNQSQIIQSRGYLESDGDHLERNQRSFELQVMGQDAGRQAQGSQDPKKRKGRQQALRQRPKTSMLFENQRESLNGRRQKTRPQQQPKKQVKQQHNHSIENLQRQVLENQKILLSNAGLQQRSQKQSKRNANLQPRHNHNNSISHMNGGNMNNQSLFANQNQAFQTNMSSSGPVSGVSANTFSKKKPTRKSQVALKTAGPQQRMQGQQIVGSYQQSQIMANLQSGLQNIQNKNLSLKMTQQHLSNNLKNFANMVGGGGGVSTTASTTGAVQQFQSNKSMRPRKQNAHKRKGSTSGQGQLAQSEFVNFEQMQQQLEGGVTLGGADIQQMGPEFSQFVQGQPVDIDQIAEGGQGMGFVPHKNLMPKTTGSQAHLLNIQQQQHEAASSVGPGLSGVLSGGAGATHKSFHSLNQTGRTAGSANRAASSVQAQSQPAGGRRSQKQ